MKRILLAAIAIAGFSVPYTASALTVDMISVTDVQSALSGPLPDGINSIDLQIPFFNNPVPVGAAGSTEPLSWLVVKIDGEPTGMIGDTFDIDFTYTVTFADVGPVVVNDSFTLTIFEFGTEFLYASGAASDVFGFGMNQGGFVESVFSDLAIKFSHGIDVILDYSLTIVPVPAAVWLLGSGLLGLIGFRRVA